MTTETKHWVYHLPEGAPHRYCRMLTDRLSMLQRDLERCQLQLHSIEQEIASEERRIEASILREWTADEIAYAKQEAKAEPEIINARK